MLGENEHCRFDNSGPEGLVRIRRLDMCTMRGSRTKMIAIHNGFQERGVRNTYESYSDITLKARVDVPTYDGKIDATIFSGRIVAMDYYFDWYEMV